MAERATVNQAAYFGVEAAYGDGAAVAHRLRSVSMALDPQATSEMFRPDGSKFPVLAVPGPEWVGADLTGKPTYTEMMWLLASLIDDGAHAVSGAGNSHTFGITEGQADTPISLHIQQGDAVRAHEFVYGLVQELALDITRQAANLTGRLIGRAVNDGVDLSAIVVTDVPLIPCVPKEFSVYLDPTAAALGTTKLTRAFRLQPRLGNRYNPVWPINASNASFATHVETPPQGECTFLFEADTAGMARLPEFRNGTTVFCRIEAVGPLIGGATYNKLTWDNAYKIREVQRFEDSDGVYAIGFVAENVRDSTWGKATNVVLVNAQADLTA
jgi:hypothetical protein